MGVSGINGNQVSLIYCTILKLVLFAYTTVYLLEQTFLQVIAPTLNPFPGSGSGPFLICIIANLIVYNYGLCIIVMFVFERV